MKPIYLQTLKFQKLRIITEIGTLALYLINSDINFSCILEARVLW